MKKLCTFIFIAAICCFCAILQAAPNVHRATFYIEEAENKSDVNISLSMIKPCLVNTFGHIRAINISDNVEECGYKIIPTVIGISAERIQNLLRVRSTIIINCWDLSANKIILTKKITFALIDGSLDQLQPQDIKRLFQKLYQGCVEYTAREAAIAFSEEISPVKVLAINENKIITDAPEGLYHAGDCFNVVRKINNYEQEIAIIRITEVKSKQATCEVVSLKNKKITIKEGDICRLTASKSVK